MAFYKLICAETGDLAQVGTVIGTVGVSALQKTAGAYSIRCNPTGTGIGYMSNIGGGPSDGSYNQTINFSFFAASLPTGPEPFMSMGPSGWVFRLNPDGSVDLNGNSISAPGVITAGQWNWISIKWVNEITDAEFNDGIVRHWVTINGTEIFTNFSYGYTNGQIPYFYLGKIVDVSGSSVDFYYADFLNFRDIVYPVALSRIKAYKFTSATPTDNTWTKSNGSTIDTVWGDTPYTTATYAVSPSTASPVAQTAKVAPISADIGTGTLLGLVAAMIAKTSATSNNGSFGIIRTYVNGGVADSGNVGVNTVDTYKQFVMATPSLALIDTLQIGWAKSSTTLPRVHTVEDAWAFVAYTPGAGGGGFTGDHIAAGGAFGSGAADFYGPVPQGAWSLSSSTADAAHGTGLATDGLVNTYWQSNDIAGPHWLQVDLGAVYALANFLYTPRQDSSVGRINSYRLDLSDDGNTWNAVSTGNFPDSTDRQVIAFTPTNARYARLIALTTY